MDAAKRRRETDAENISYKRQRATKQVAEQEDSLIKQKPKSPEKQKKPGARDNFKRRKPVLNFDSWLDKNRYISKSGKLYEDLTYLVNRYKKYVSDFVYNQETDYFEDHCEEEWFLDEYQLENQKKVFQKQKLAFRNNFNLLKSDFTSLTASETLIKYIKLQSFASSKEEYERIKTIEETKEDEVVVGNHYPRDLVVFVPKISLKLSKESFSSAVKEIVPNAEISFLFSNPVHSKREMLDRSCWLVFGNAEDRQELLEKRDIFLQGKIEFIPQKLFYNKLTHILFAQPSRIKKDLENSLKLAKLLDEKYLSEGDGIESVLQRDDTKTFFATFEENAGKLRTAKLDIVLLYLRRIYYVCYYAGRKYSDEGDLLHLAVLPRLRPKFDENTIVTDYESYERGFDKIYENLVDEVQREGERIQVNENHFEKLKEKYFSRFVSSNSLKEAEDKFKCLLCEKKFRGMSFLQKHLESKHPEGMEEAMKKTKRRALKTSFFESKVKPIESVEEILKYQDFSSYEQKSPEKSYKERSRSKPIPKARTSLNFLAL
eukprot:maker-scaffold_8-snap-gene-5.4-mRNA-1 protein AED:0.00 eAED:0.00 QI:178/1/1/1/1/1/3/132/544